jgi:hypothetical protein
MREGAHALVEQQQGKVLVRQADVLRIMTDNPLKLQLETIKRYRLSPHLQLVAARRELQIRKSRFERLQPQIVDAKKLEWTYTVQLKTKFYQYLFVLAKFALIESPCL